MTWIHFNTPVTRRKWYFLNVPQEQLWSSPQKKWEARILLRLKLKKWEHCWPNSTEMEKVNSMWSMMSTNCRGRHATYYLPTSEIIWFKKGNRRNLLVQHFIVKVGIAKYWSSKSESPPQSRASSFTPSMPISIIKFTSASMKRKLV